MNRKPTIGLVMAMASSLLFFDLGCATPGQNRTAKHLSPRVENQLRAKVQEGNLRQATAHKVLDTHPDSTQDAANLIRPVTFVAQDKASLVSESEIESQVAPENPSTVPQPAPFENQLSSDRVSTSIDLVTALQMAGGQNPRVAFANERILEAQANSLAAQSLWLPSIRAGLNYNKHDGRLQDFQGDVSGVSRSSVYGGLGAHAVGSGSPAVPGIYANYHLRDAVYQPRIAQHVVAANTSASHAEINRVLLDTGLAYVDLVEAAQLVSLAQQATDSTNHLAELTKSFSESGEGLPSDADRVGTELVARQVDLLRAHENQQTASARLAQLLSHPYDQLLLPDDSNLTPLDLAETICGKSLETGHANLNELVATGLANRPELAENSHLVGEAVQRLKRECNSTLLPSVLLGTSYGANGGGVGGNIENFGDRVDFDAVVYWEVRNLGRGETAARCAAQARLNQAQSKQLQIMDQVSREVSEAHTQITSRLVQIDTAQSGIQLALDSYRKNMDRISDGEGLPIEVLQSIQALDQSQRQYAQVIADFNRAQFRLLYALGWPID